MWCEPPLSTLWIVPTCSASMFPRRCVTHFVCSSPGAAVTGPNESVYVVPAGTWGGPLLVAVLLAPHAIIAHSAPAHPITKESGRTNLKAYLASPRHREYATARGRYATDASQRRRRWYARCTARAFMQSSTARYPHTRSLPPTLELSPGEWVRVKSEREIEATLDADGMLDALPFMPE